MSRLVEQKVVQGAGALTPEEIATHLPDLPGWVLAEDSKSIRREWRMRNFRQAAALANLVAWQAEDANHHPDILFGWGHVRVTFATHSANSVTLNDLIMAARINRAIG
ncbi:4a-hydroxytetrahydrobiopterin dehydratase [Paracoccus ravus]|uniref:4a-hydroxytetrahydrobiopterin dehydratase n=1 Tax=Paracoccus ravus TaxID=2447760 RepID=UPI00106E8DD4|nr:4a-hydroxytetrahydrobiopterin dehydratase [Paracoccus ravus]